MRKKSSSPSILSKLGNSLNQLMGVAPPANLVDAILVDHADLKDLIKILKDPQLAVAKKEVAFKRFKVLLLSHSEAEEKALYSVSKHLQGLELKTDEGFVEHEVAKDLLLKIRFPRAKGGLRHWKAQLQVLGELVEHHLKEEERDLLPQVRKKLDAETNASHGKLFMRLRLKAPRPGGSRLAEYSR